MFRGFLEKNHSAENFAGKIETIGQSVKKILKQLKCILIIIIIMSLKSVSAFEDVIGDLKFRLCFCSGVRIQDR